MLDEIEPTQHCEVRSAIGTEGRIEQWLLSSTWHEKSLVVSVKIGPC